MRGSLWYAKPLIFSYDLFALTSLVYVNVLILGDIGA